VIVAILSSSVQTSRHEDPQAVDIQEEGELLVARLEEDEEEQKSSIQEGVEEVWMTFSRCLSIPKLQMAIAIQGVGCRSR
jgi:hypothetical protein